MHICHIVRIATLCSSHFICVCWDSLHLSIFTATVMTESAFDSPYAVASTTFPNAPDPSVFPGDKKTDTKLLFAILLPSHKLAPCQRS